MNNVTRQLQGREIKDVSIQDAHHITFQFLDGSALHIHATSTGINLELEKPSFDQPTKRQLEYLRFIAKYIQQFRRAPAEADIQRHFLVSGPSVNAMMQTLEKRGFIVRKPGVARSIELRYCL